MEAQNLDAMTLGELAAHADDLRGELQRPRRGESIAALAKVAVLAYTGLRAAAMQLRLQGDIERALCFEHAADALYDLEIARGPLSW